MPKVKISTAFNTAAEAKVIREASEYGLQAVGAQALEDTNICAPKDQGSLRDSSYTHSDSKPSDGEFVIRWDTPYARYLWHGDVMHGTPTNRTYGPEKLNFTEALAREEWAKYAAEAHRDEWQKVYATAVRRKLGK